MTFSGLLHSETWAWEEGMPTRIKLLAPLTQFSSAHGDLTVPAGFVFDGASIPRAARWLIDPFDARVVRAAGPHDLRCSPWPLRGSVYHIGTWQEAHGAFEEGCIAGGLSGVTLKLVTQAVWRFGPRWRPNQVIPVKDAHEFLQHFRFDWEQRT